MYFYIISKINKFYNLKAKYRKNDISKTYVLL